MPSNSRLIAYSVPASLKPGEPLSASVTFQNTGTDVWTPGAYLLGSLNDDTAWTSKRWPLPKAVPPGQTVTIPITGVTPQGPNPCPLNVRIVQEFVQWIGQTASASVTITGGTPVPPPLSPQFPPCLPGDEVSVECFNTGALDSKTALRTLEWVHTGPDFRINEAKMWIGVDNGMRADIQADVVRKRDGTDYIVISGQDDHYSEPGSLDARTIERKPANGFLLKTNDRLVMGTYCGDFSPTKNGHIAIRVILYGAPK